MKNILSITLLLVPGCLTLAGIAHAQVGTMKWHFHSRPEVVSALTRTRGDLRKTYEVLVSAGRQGFTNSGIEYYEKIVVGKEFDATAQDSAAFAFAFDLGYSFRPWHWKKDPVVLKTKSTEITAQFFRERAYQYLPNSPEVLVMRSFQACTQDTEERKKAVAMLQKATRLAPNWADAYYWLGEAANNYAITFYGAKANKPARARFGKLAISAYDKAEKLDPAVRPYLFESRANAYESIGGKDSASLIPGLIQSNLLAFPNFDAWLRTHRKMTVTRYKELWDMRIAEMEK